MDGYNLTQLTIEEFYQGLETFIKDNQERYKTSNPLDTIMEKGIPKGKLNIFVGKSTMPSMFEDYIKSLNQNKDE